MRIGTTARRGPSAFPSRARRKSVNAVEVSTVVYAPREEVYEFLLDFTGYGRYSSYIEHIERTGDGGPGTRYDITVSWWKLRYTANSEVTETAPPERIDWQLVGGLTAHGHWRIEPVEGDEDATDLADVAPGTEPDEKGRGPANRVVLRIEYDPDSVSGSMLSLPAFVPLDAVVERVVPHVESEAESIVEDVVAELEGERRPVELTVRERPDER